MVASSPHPQAQLRSRDSGHGGKVGKRQAIFTQGHGTGPGRVPVPEWGWWGVGGCTAKMESCERRQFETSNGTRQPTPGQLRFLSWGIPGLGMEVRPARTALWVPAGPSSAGWGQPYDQTL